VTYYRLTRWASSSTWPWIPENVLLSFRVTPSRSEGPRYGDGRKHEGSYTPTPLWLCSQARLQYPYSCQQSAGSQAAAYQAISLHPSGPPCCMRILETFALAAGLADSGREPEKTTPSPTPRFSHAQAMPLAVISAQEPDTPSVQHHFSLCGGTLSFCFRMTRRRRSVSRAGRRG
jgi:hypothetical protein